MDTTSIFDDVCDCYVSFYLYYDYYCYCYHYYYLYLCVFYGYGCLFQRVLVLQDSRLGPPPAVDDDDVDMRN